MYEFKIVGDITWIAQNVHNIEDQILGPKPAIYFNLDNSDFDVVDNNDNIPLTIESPDVKTIKLSRNKNCNILNQNDLIKLLKCITLKLPMDLLSKPLHDVNDEATDKLLTSFASMSNDNGKAPAISNSAIIMYSKKSLHAFGSGSTCYSSCKVPQGLPKTSSLITCT